MPYFSGSSMCGYSHSTVVVEVWQWPPNKEQVGTNCLVAEPALLVVGALVVEAMEADPEAVTLSG